MKRYIVFFLIGLSHILVAQLPKEFVYVTDQIPDIQLDLRYCSYNNFVGEPIDAYNAEVCILTKDATIALKKVQEELRTRGLSLKVFDAYRPQSAVNHFSRWARQVEDTLMKQQFYPGVDKRYLFKLGYIASKSGHSRGSTIDLTIVNTKTGEELDMGSPYDFFGEVSWVEDTSITKEQQANRLLLQQIMLKYNFRNYPKEWWHFTLRWEPFPDTYFDFPVE